MNAKANTTLPRVLLVGLSHELPNTHWSDFYSDTHFLDYDVVIVDPHGALVGPGHQYKAEDGVLMLESGSGQQFRRRYTHATQKIVNFVDKGGLAIMFLRAMPTLIYDQGVRYKDLVRTDLNEFLPWNKNSVHVAHGNNIEFGTQGPIGQFWASTGDLWGYEAVYDYARAKPGIAYVKGHPDEVVANFIETKGRGFIVMTPVLTFEATPNDASAVNEASKRFVQAVKRLYESLRAEGPVSQLPEWASEYRLPAEAGLRDEITDVSERIDALQEQIRQQTEALDELCVHKVLVTGHDSALEGAVDRVLNDLGMKVEPGPKGRVDRTATYGDRKFAVEVQGVVKGAKEDHARALTIWVQEVAQQDGKEPKGLLVVNPYRDTPLAERGDKKFWSGDTIKICKHQRHCAITGLQLLGLYLDAMADDTKRQQLVEQLFNTEGVFEGYDDWRQFLTHVVSKTPEQS